MTTRQYKDAINGNIRDIIMVKLHPFMCSDHVDRCIGYPDHKVEVDEAVGQIEALFSESEPKSSPNTTPLNEELDSIDLIATIACLFLGYAPTEYWKHAVIDQNPTACRKAEELIQTLVEEAYHNGRYDLAKEMIPELEKELTRFEPPNNTTTRSKE